MEQAHRKAVRRHAGLASQPHAELGAGECRLQGLDVGHGLLGIEALAIGRGEVLAPSARRRAALGFARRRLQCQAQPVVPRGRGIGQRALELGEVGRRAVRRVELQGVERLGEG